MVPVNSTEASERDFEALLRRREEKMALKAHATPSFRKPRLVPDESWPFCASLPGSLAASFALGSARLSFEATPVVDADHGESESRSRRR